MKVALKVREFHECKSKFDHGLKWPQGLETEKVQEQKSLYNKSLQKA